MKFTLELTEEEYDKLKAGVLGPAPPSMDFELSDEFMEGWDCGQSAAELDILRRLVRT